MWGLIIFILITIVYFIAKYANVATNNVLMIAYYLAVILSQFMANWNVSQSLCGSVQWNIVIAITLIPWVIIFSLLIGLLSVFEGWLTPFANTIGYGVIKMMGVSDLLNQILESKMPTTDNTSTDVKLIAESLEHLYSDNSLFINELHLNNFDTIWDIMKNGGLFKKDVTDEMRESLHNMVRLRFMISEFIWYLLTGALITLISYNYLANSGCQQSASDMEALHKDMITKEQQLNDEKNNTTPQIYESDE